MVPRRNVTLTMQLRTDRLAGFDFSWWPGPGPVGRLTRCAARSGNKMDKEKAPRPHAELFGGAAIGAKGSVCLGCRARANLLTAIPILGSAAPSQASVPVGHSHVPAWPRVVIGSLRACG